MADPIAKRTEDLQKAYKHLISVGFSHEEAIQKAAAEAFLKDVPKPPESPIKEGWLEVKKALKKWGVNAGWICAAVVGMWISFYVGERGWSGLFRMPAFNALVISVVVFAVLVSGRKKNGGGPSA